MPSKPPTPKSPPVIRGGRRSPSRCRRPRYNKHVRTNRESAMRVIAAIVIVLAAWRASLDGQAQPGSNQPPVRRALPQVTQEYITIDAPVVALQHVRVIDGTGAPAVVDQTVLIERGTIAAIGPSASLRPPAGARVLDLAGRTAMPRSVGMHEHLFYAGSSGQGRLAGVPEY